MSNYPSDLRYTKDHEWARIDGKRVVIGITEFAVHQLGDITMVDLDGQRLTFASPLSGKVVKTNDPLRDSPETLNEDCYDEGWMVELELSSLDEIKQLMTSEEYAKYVKDHS